MGEKVQKYNLLTIIGLLVYAGTRYLSQKGIFSANVEMACFLVAYLLSAYSIFQKIAKHISKKIFLDGYVLLILATVGAFAVGRYEEAVFVILIFQIGNTLELLVTNHSEKQIREFVDVQEVMVHKRVFGEEVLVHPSELSEGDIIVVRAGEKVAVDGVVLSGNSSVDMQMLTGESVPCDVTPSCRVYGGSLNLTGVLDVKVLRTYEHSIISKILHVVEHAEEEKTESESTAIYHVRNYCIVILAIAVCMIGIPYLYDKSYDWVSAVERTILFLIAACPCSMEVSVSTAFLRGMLAAARKGIVVKSGSYLERLTKVNTFLFDKTGTLTEGVFEVQEIHPIGRSKEELLEIATYLESYSNHPIAVSLRKAYGKKLEFNCIDEFEEIAGYGLRAIYKGKPVYLGNARLLKERNIHFQEVHRSGSVLYLAVFGEYAGYIVVSDTIKKDVREMVKYLKKRCSAAIVMVTGDTELTSKTVAKELQVDYYYANQRPEDKLQRLEECMEMQDDVEYLAAVGDGIHDAAILTKADIGIVMGGLSSAAAIEAADIILMQNEPLALVDVVRIAKETMKVIRQNLICSMIMKFALIILAVFGMITVKSAIIVEVCVMILCLCNTVWASKEPS